jgi:hypothetical protein
LNLLAALCSQQDFVAFESDRFELARRERGEQDRSVPDIGNGTSLRPDHKHCVTGKLDHITTVFVDNVNHASEVIIDNRAEALHSATSLVFIMDQPGSELRGFS